MHIHIYCYKTNTFTLMTESAGEYFTWSLKLINLLIVITWSLQEIQVCLRRANNGRSSSTSYFWSFMFSMLFGLIPNSQSFHLSRNETNKQTENMPVKYQNYFFFINTTMSHTYWELWISSET